MKRRFVAIVGSVAVALSMSLGTVGSADATTAKKFKNCTQMNKSYAHGVGQSGAKDKTKSKPVTNFKRSNAIYKVNKGSDRDKDGIACEKR